MPMIQLTEEEQKIANAIRDFARMQNPPTTARFAGGWVRDKIMGVSSHDIDVTLDNMSGYTFALGLSREISGGRTENTADYSDGQSDPPSVHKIQANPDKSKHLETAVVSIYGISVDFAHLRSETYANTRIPIIQPGTPQEDALRRDLTINALFYNLSTGKIEDFTGTGLKDIRDRLIRTPLDPKITLHEDPLRILRIFRFKAKLGFAIDPSIYEALALPEIAYALRHKVTSERIEAELFKMLSYENGYVGMAEIIKTGYIQAVFTPEANIEVDKLLSLQLLDRCKDFVSRLQARYKDACQDETKDHYENIGHDGELHAAPCPDIQELVWSHTDARIIWLYMALHNYLGIKVRRGKRVDYVNVVVLRDSLKSSRQRIACIQGLEEAVAYMSDGGNGDLTRLALICGEHLFESLLICAVTGRRKDAESIALGIICRSLYDCYRTPAIVTGNDLKCFSFPLKDYRAILFNCLVYQIDHPDATKEEILASLSG